MTQLSHTSTQHPPLQDPSVSRNHILSLHSHPITRIGGVIHASTVAIADNSAIDLHNITGTIVLAMGRPIISFQSTGLYSSVGSEEDFVDGDEILKIE